MLTLWHNGGKNLVLAALFAAVAVLVLAAAWFTAYFWPNEEPFLPLDFNNPQPVVGTTTLYVGDTVKIHSIKCNTSDIDIQILGEPSFFRRHDGGERVDLYPYRVGGGVADIKAGKCLDRIFTNKLVQVDGTPLAPGDYSVEGINIAIHPKTGQTHSVGWYTEVFTIE